MSEKLPISQVEFHQAINMGSALRQLEKVSAEQERKPPWEAYESSLAKYEETFTVFGDQVIYNFLKARETAGLPTIALDFASAGRAMRDLADEHLVSAGLSIGLFDPRPDELAAQDRAKNIFVLSSGNLIRRNMWNVIDKWLRQQNSIGTDLLLCRSVGGFEATFGSNPSIYAILVNRAIRLMNPSALFLSDIPPSLDSHLVRPWIDDLERNHPEFAVKYAPRKQVMMVTRSSSLNI